MDGNKPKIPKIPSPSGITPSVSKGDSSIGDFIQKNPKILALLGVIGLILLTVVIESVRNKK